MRRAAWIGIVLAAAFVGGWWTMFRMPGKSWRGPLPELTDREAALAVELRRDVEVLAGEIGDRNVLTAADRLERARRFLEGALADAGYAVQRQHYDVGGVACANVWVEVPGGARAGEIVVVGGHYDSVPGCPAANDNASGVAATLALARALRGHRPARTLRFVLFVNEEPPFYRSDDMGSLVFARACRERGENVVAMLSFETIGYYSEAPGSQRYPGPLRLLYPSTGDFIAFVSNVGSRRLLHRVIGSFREHARFPSQGGALPGGVPGVGWSDHWAFWQLGYPAVMVTDTAPFRYPHYHRATDTADRLDYERMGRVVEGLRRVVVDLGE